MQPFLLFPVVFFVTMQFIMAVLVVPRAISNEVTSRSEFFYQKLPADSDYLTKRNPLSFTEEQRVKGEQLFETYCVACHGFNGVGPTPETITKLDRQPPSLLRAAREIFSTDRDAYLFWTISEGGHPLDSPMPAFKEIFSSTEIWQIVLYINGINEFLQKPVQ